jgi:hypothetical protein
MHKLSLRSTKELNDSAREEAALEVDVEVPILYCTSLEGDGLLCFGARWHALLQFFFCIDFRAPEGRLLWHFTTSISCSFFNYYILALLSVQS